MRDVIILFFMIAAISSKVELYAYFTAKKSYMSGYEKRFDDCIEALKEVSKEYKKEK
jgi:hypothetical protein